MKNWRSAEDTRRFWGLTEGEEAEGMAEKESDGPKGGRTSDIRIDGVTGREETGLFCLQPRGVDTLPCWSRASRLPTMPETHI